MLTEAYIEALFVDEELAELVWETLVANAISPSQARYAWLSVRTGRSVIRQTIPE